MALFSSLNTDLARPLNFLSVPEIIQIMVFASQSQTYGKFMTVCSAAE